jgi:D-alanyl-D-alanine endopeptidase (penicillin-binding protein 7)
VKNSKKSIMHALSMSILLALSSTSYAELVVNNNPASTSANSSSASLNWSASDASQLMEDDDSLEISPQGSTSLQPLYEVVVLQVLVHLQRHKKHTDSRYLSFQ